MVPKTIAAIVAWWLGYVAVNKLDSLRVRRRRIGGAEELRQAAPAMDPCLRRGDEVGNAGVTKRIELKRQYHNPAVRAAPQGAEIDGVRGKAPERGEAEPCGGRGRALSPEIARRSPENAYIA